MVGTGVLYCVPGAFDEVVLDLGDVSSQARERLYVYKYSVKQTAVWK